MAQIRVPAGWKLLSSGQRIGIEVRTEDFLDALDLFRAVGEVAEELEHHPDLHLERWNRVRIESYSHDVGHLTDRDERLAERIQEILDQRGLVARE